jgi:hypothetical protein
VLLLLLIIILVSFNPNKTSKGSVIVQFQLYITTQEPDPLLPLKRLVKDNGGKINGLVIDYKSIRKPKGKTLKNEQSTTISNFYNDNLLMISIVCYTYYLYNNLNSTRALFGRLTVFHWCMKNGNDVTTNKVI